MKNAIFEVVEAIFNPKVLISAVAIFFAYSIITESRDINGIIFIGLMIAYFIGFGVGMQVEEGKSKIKERELRKENGDLLRIIVQKNKEE